MMITAMANPASTEQVRTDPVAQISSQNTVRAMQEQLDATLEALEGLSEAVLKEVLASVQKTQGESIKDVLKIVPTAYTVPDNVDPLTIATNLSIDLPAEKIAELATAIESKEETVTIETPPVEEKVIPSIVQQREHLQS